MVALVQYLLATGYGDHRLARTRPAPGNGARRGWMLCFSVAVWALCCGSARYGEVAERLKAAVC